MPFNIRTNSRFSESDPILTKNGRATFGVAKKFRFMNRSNLGVNDIRLFNVDARTARRPDLIALDVYNDVDLFWIPILFNHIQNPFQWPTNRQVIELPIPAVVFAEL